MEVTQVIYNCDCRQVPEGVIKACHVMITDPPYSEHVHNNAVSCSAYTGGQGIRDRDFGFANLSDDLRAWVAKAAALVRKWSIVYSDVESAQDLRKQAEHAGATYVRTIPWVRWSMPQTSGDRPTTGQEKLVLVWGDEPIDLDLLHFWGAMGGAKGWHGNGNLTHYAHTALRGKDKHPTEKPLDQSLDLVVNYSEPGETVFDPFAGAGSIGLACRLLGRAYIGCELSPQWAERAARRIASAELSARDAERLSKWREARAEELATIRAAKHTRSKQELHRIEVLECALAHTANILPRCA